MHKQVTSIYAHTLNLLYIVVSKSFDPNLNILFEHTYLKKVERENNSIIYIYKLFK